MNFNFVCISCGKSEILKDPHITEKPCSCGATMVMSLLVPESRTIRHEAKKCGEGESLGALWSAGPKLKRPERPLKRYKAVICPKCHTPQMTSARKTLKCLKCNKGTRLLREGGRNLLLFDTSNPTTAVLYVKKLSEVCKYMGETGNTKLLWSLQSVFDETNKL